jgi:hypothetical protein
VRPIPLRHGEGSDDTGLVDLKHRVHPRIIVSHRDQVLVSASDFSLGEAWIEATPPPLGLHPGHGSCNSSGQTSKPTGGEPNVGETS